MQSLGQPLESDCIDNKDVIADLLLGGGAWLDEVSYFGGDPESISPSPASPLLSAFWVPCTAFL